MALRWLILLIAAAVTMVASTPTFSTPASTTPFVGVKEPNCTAGETDETTCQCDPLCARYGDCCRSSPYFVPEEQRLGASPFICSELFGSQVFVMRTCPSDWQDSNTRTRCEKPSFKYQDMLDAPLTSTSTNITYLNWYCASCHQDLQSDTTIIWDPNFECHIEGRWAKPHFFQPPEELVNNISYNALSSKWNINIRMESRKPKPFLNPVEVPKNWDNNYTPENATIETKNYECDLSFEAPITALERQRGCRTDIVSSCAENWIGTDVQRECEAYISHICYQPIDSYYYPYQQTYRNYNCFICNNGENVEPCFGIGYPLTTTPLTPVRSFSIILNWKRLRREVCGSSEMYDPLAHLCRKIYTS